MKVASLVIFASGALVGGSLVYIFLKEKIRREVESGNTELLDAIQQSMEDRYEAMYNRKTEKKEEVRERPDTTPKSSIEKPDFSEKVSYNSIKKDAEDILKEYIVPFAEEEENTEKKTTPETSAPGEPYMMCYEDMMEQDKGYSTMVCHFYPDGDDGILTDDHGNQLQDPANEVGWDNLIYLRDVERDVIYVRNDRLNLDYEIYYNDDIY